MKRGLAWITLAVAAVVLAAGFTQQPAKTQETEAAGRSAKEPAESPSQTESGADLFWRLANFALLVGGLGWVIRKKAPAFYAARDKAIQKALLEAEEVRADADARMAAVDARLANLEAEVEALRRESKDEAQAQMDHIRQETAAQLARIREHAEQEIAGAAKAARLELKRHSAELALALAEQKLREGLNQQDQDVLVERFVHTLAHPASWAQTS